MNKIKSINVLYILEKRKKYCKKQKDIYNDNPDNNLFLKDDFQIGKYTSDVTLNLRSYRVQSCEVGMCTWP